MLRSLCVLAAQLDCLVALSMAAENYRMCRPEIKPKGCATQIVRGRHLLQELSVNTFIPNDTHIGCGTGMIKLITGPNFSGKSVYMKQVGLITLMAHIGSFVPADSAAIPLVDRIFTAMATINSINISQSTFAQDLAQVASMLHHATSDSLLLVDEFGNGTTSTDGVALLVGVVLDLLQKGRNCPKALFSTHFSNVHDWMPVNSLLEHQCMQVDGTDTHDNPDDVVFLYKLVSGKNSDSHGRLCAAMAGVDTSILTRAEAIVSCLEAGIAPLPYEHNGQTAVELTRDQAINLTDAEERSVQDFLALDLDDNSMPDFFATLH